ncbi:MAG TPA: GGDEF domain-containing protein [Burkholderiaceae bacterium]|nr:GGDEF domain-containing protein [Burkholderiaceae bacterium]
MPPSPAAGDPRQSPQAPPSLPTPPTPPIAKRVAGVPAPRDPFRRVSHIVLRLGRSRSLLALTAVTVLASVALAELVITVLGRGDRVIAAASATLASLVLTPLLGSLMLRLVFDLEAARQQLAELAIRDELTGISNRRHFMATIQREWDLARRHASIGTLLLIDADGFKGINDTHGHLCGDELLRVVAKVIGGSLRHVDLLARFGGEEFIVFLPHTDNFGALDVAERIRSRVQATQITWQGRQIAMTVSIGVAPIRRELPSLDWMIHEADTALYAAKTAGRNCVRTLEFSSNMNDPTTRSFKA